MLHTRKGENVPFPAAIAPEEVLSASSDRPVPVQAAPPDAEAAPASHSLLRRHR